MFGQVAVHEQYIVRHRSIVETFSGLHLAPATPSKIKVGVSCGLKTLSGLHPITVAPEINDDECQLWGSNPRAVACSGS